jgi:pantoate--beta-alanine ligase
MKKLIQEKKTAKIDYICIVDPDDLAPVKKIKNKVLVALAVCLGKTRLIDNICLNC